MGQRGSGSDLRHNVQALVSSQPFINAETLMKSRRDSDMRFAHSIMGGWEWGENFFRKASKQTGRTPATRNEFAHTLWSLYDFFICVSHILFVAPLSKRCFKLDEAWKTLSLWLPPPKPCLPPRLSIGLVARALPNMKLAQMKRRINKRPGILFVIFNPSCFPNSLVKKFCSSVYIILIESYIRAYKYHSWMQLQFHMKAAIILSALTTEKKRKKNLCISSFSPSCPIQPPALAHSFFFLPFLKSSGERCSILWFPPIRYGWWATGIHETTRRRLITVLMKVAQCKHMQPGRVLHHHEPCVRYRALRLGAATLLRGGENHQKHMSSQYKWETFSILVTGRSKWKRKKAILTIDEGVGGGHWSYIQATKGKRLWWWSLERTTGSLMPPHAMGHKTFPNSSSSSTEWTAKGKKKEKRKL